MTARPTQAEVGDRRINYDFQVFKAICITLICAGHIWNKGFDGPFDLFPIYSFHVAAFAFVSGYFYKPNNDAEPAHFIVRKARALLVPTFIANVAYGVLAVALHRLGFDWQGGVRYYYELSFETLVRQPLLSGHQFNLNYTMWFTISLLIAEACYVSIRWLAALRGNQRTVEAVACAAALLLGSWAIRRGGESGLEPSLALVMGRAFFLMAFVGIGRLFALKPDALRVERVPAVIVLCCTLQLALTFACDGNVRYIPAWLRFPHGVALTYLVTLNGIVFWLCISKVLAPAIGKAPSLNAIANNTYSIMMHHRLWIFILCGAFGLLSRHTPYFSAFNVEDYLVKDSYHFYPGNYPQASLLYLVVGMALPLLVREACLSLKGRASHLLKRR